MVKFFALGLRRKLFRAEFDPKMQFRCIVSNLTHYSGWEENNR